MNFARHVIPAFLMVLTCGTCVKIGAKMGTAERASWRLVTSPPLASLKTSRINLVTLGHRGLYDDFATIWAIQFLADQSLTKKATAKEVNDAIRSITQHQPRLESLYLLSCYVMALDFNSPENCEGISVDGLKAFPNSWRIPMTQGFVATYKMNDDLKAASFFELAASRPKSPAYVGRLAKKLSEKGSISGQDLNDTLDMLREVPGGTRIIEILRNRLRNQQTSPQSGGSP